MLRKEDNQRIIRKVADDTATLRTSMSTAHSTADASIKSIRSGQSSALGGTEFDFDDAIVNSTAYRWVLNQHMRSRSVGNTPRQSSQVLRHPSQGTGRTDEGYGSGTTGSRTPNRQPSYRLQVPDVGLRITNSEDDVSRSHTTALARTSSAAYLNIRRSKSATSRLKSSGSTREKIRSVFRSGSLNSKPSFSVAGSLTDVRALRRYRKAEPNVSIDLSSPSGAAAPPIVQAAQLGDLAEVEAQIKRGADIEARHDGTARTALAVAAHCGGEDIVALLLHNAAQADNGDVFLMTPLHLAASRGHTGIVELLLCEDIDIDQRDSQGRTPFWIATEAGHIETANLLLECGCKVNTRAMDQMTVLHAAAKEGDPDTVAFLLRTRIDIHAKDSKLNTALHYACESGHVDVVHKLLSAGAKIEARGETQSTPLISAATKGQLATADLLLRKGALINAVDERQMTALHWAAANGHVEVVALLIDKKASIVAAEHTGKQPLHCATYAKQFAVVEFLLRKHAPANARCKNDFMPLHAACNVGSLELVRLFLASGVPADASIRGTKRLPIHIAVVAGSFETVEFILDRWDKVDPMDSTGETPLTLACASGKIDIVQLLLQRGASPARQSNNDITGVSPMCVAAAKGHVDIVSLLLRNGGYASERDEMGWNALLHAAHWGHYKLLKFLLDRCDLPAKQNLVALFFNYVGFASNVVIDDEERELISNLVVDVSDELVRRGQLWDGTPMMNMPGSGSTTDHPQSHSYYAPKPPAIYSPTPPQELASTPAKAAVVPSRTETSPNTTAIVRPSRPPIPMVETPPPAPTFRNGIPVHTAHVVRQTSCASCSSERGSIVSSPVAAPKPTTTPATPTPTPPVTDTAAASTTTIPHPICIPRPSLSSSYSVDHDGTGTSKENDAHTPTIRYSLVETIVGNDGSIRTSAHDTNFDTDDARRTPTNVSVPRLPPISQVGDFNINAIISARTDAGAHSDLEHTPSVTAPNSNPNLPLLIINSGSWDGRLQSSVVNDGEESDADSTASFDTAIEEVEVYEFE